MWFCDLSEAKTLSDIISQVGYALSIPLTTGRSDDKLPQPDRRSARRREHPADPR